MEKYNLMQQLVLEEGDNCSNQLNNNELPHKTQNNLIALRVKQIAESHLLDANPEI